MYTFGGRKGWVWESRISRLVEFSRRHFGRSKTVFLSLAFCFHRNSLLCVLNVPVHRQRYNAVKAIRFKEAELIASHAKKQEKKLESTHGRRIGSWLVEWFFLYIGQKTRFVCLFVRLSGESFELIVNLLLLLDLKPKWSYKPFKRVHLIHRSGDDPFLIYF